MIENNNEYIPRYEKLQLDRDAMREKIAELEEHNKNLISGVFGFKAIIAEQGYKLTQVQQELKIAVEALRDLHDDINTRKEDGARFNPGTLFALGRARSVLASIKD